MPPDFIRESETWGPLFALGAFVVMLLAAAAAQIILQVVLKRRERVDPGALDVQVIRTIRGPVVLFLTIFGVFLGFTSLTALTSEPYDALDEWGGWAGRVWTVVVIAEVSYLTSNLTRILIVWYLSMIAVRTATDIDAKLLPPVRRILPLVIYSVGVLVALDVIGIPISPLLAGFGIGGLAVALAVQPTLGNFFAGTYLVTEGELKEGDYIELEGGPAGFVVDVGWRSLKMRSRFNNLVIVPNSKMAESIVTNYFSPTPSMNVIVTSGVSYDADLDHVERVVKEVAAKIVAESPLAIKDAEPFFGFSAFGDSNVDFFIFLQATDRNGSFSLTSDLIKRIHSRFKEEGIEINYPVRKLVPFTANATEPDEQSRRGPASH